MTGRYFSTTVDPAELRRLPVWRFRRGLRDTCRLRNALAALKADDRVPRPRQRQRVRGGVRLPVRVLSTGWLALSGVIPLFDIFVKELRVVLAKILIG